MQRLRPLPLSRYVRVIDHFSPLHSTYPRFLNSSPSSDYCKESESLPLLIQARTSISRSDPTSLTDQGYWFHFLEDKIAAYLLSLEQNVPSPEIFCCVTTAAALSDCLNSHISAGVDSLVIKATSFHSNQGVYVLVPDPSTNGTINLLDKRPCPIPTLFRSCRFYRPPRLLLSSSSDTPCQPSTKYI